MARHDVYLIFFLTFKNNLALALSKRYRLNYLGNFPVGLIHKVEVNIA